MSGFEIAADAAAFDDAVNGGDLIIAKFQTKACVICRRLEPGLKQLADRTEATLRIMDVDAEDNEDLAQRYNVRAVPTLILFKDGRELAKCNGFQSTSMLRDWLAPHVGD
ncbi:MAG: thioredoxin family protein [Alphaproteobacteria bacterium]|nr:thioredoxin family protein [Alphaproteobacteria bacterium]